MSRHHLLIWFAVLIVNLASALAAPPPPATLVLRGGNIITLDDKQPKATALAVRGDRIAALGSDRQIQKFMGPKTRVIDLRGRLAVPGFIEGHGHFLGLGRTRMQLDLMGAKNWAEIVRLVAKAAKQAKRGEWIIGRGWHQEHWDRPPEPNIDGYPTHAALSKVSPHNPVLLTHRTGHMVFANTAAMRAARVTRDSPDLKGGKILRDQRGEPTGVFRETAQRQVRWAHAAALGRQTAKQREADTRRAIELATRECLSKGITSFQDAGSSFETIDRFKRLADEGKLKLRLWVMLSESNDRLARRAAEYRMIDRGGGFLTVRAIKRMADGALGSHGAWLLEPYADMPSSRGLQVQSLALIRETARLAIRHDLQLCTHAIGDRANREILDLYAAAFRKSPAKKDLRWRIEHAQHLHPADIPRFAKLGVIASMQANHCTSDGPFVIARLGGSRAKHGAYAWRSLLEAGARIINGTDAPVEPVDPLGSFRASVTRQMAGGKVFFAKQRMTRLEALRSYTIAAAHAAFEEKSKGTLSPGKLADIVVLSKNILTCPEADLPKARVDLTIVGGQVAFQR